MKTVVPPSLRLNADWPYHSTRMLLLRLGRQQGAGGGPAVLVADLAAAAHQRRDGGDQAGDDRERERGVQAVAERRGDQVGEEPRPGEQRVVVRREPGQHVRTQQVLDRVVAQEGREEARYGRQL